MASSSVERFSDKEEVDGSTPSSPTINLQNHSKKMPELENGKPIVLESRKPTEPERIMGHNNRIIRKLRRLFVDDTEVQDILRQSENYSKRISTFDETKHGGLDMTREWGNTISNQDGQIVLRVQPPVLLGIQEESIHIFQGNSPMLEVRISPIAGQQLTYSLRTDAVKESKRILDRLSKQLTLKKKVLSQSD